MPGRGLRSRFAPIAGMRRATVLVEEATEHDQRAKLQDGCLPIGGEALQEGEPVNRKSQ